VPPEDLKECSDCKQSKPLTNFYFHKGKRSGKPYSYCKACDHSKRVLRQYRKAGKPYLRPSQSIESRIGVCEGCSTTTMVVSDHNHRTGQVRGMLCRPCNGILGRYGDDPERLMDLVKYLRRHGEG
jgi:hypothetical protein